MSDTSKEKDNFCNLLWNHFHADPAQLPLIKQKFAVYEQADIHFAMEKICGKEDGTEIYGLVFEDFEYEFSLAKLAHTGTSEKYHIGSVEYVDVPLSDGQSQMCVKRGVYLFQWHDGVPVAVLVHSNEMHHAPEIEINVMAESKQITEAVCYAITKEVKNGAAFRGKILSIEGDCYGKTHVKYHTLPHVEREDVILPKSLLDRIDRQTIAFSEHAEKLKKAGRHLKRGVLFHGPPGTGKTYTAMYLASRMEGRTVFLITGGAAGLIERACQMARVLQPATIILEDVDLIGTERRQQTVGANVILFELLNQMDGLSTDADVLFILTTNRPDVLEEALSSRPGRIDQAYEVPPPDAECRLRLIELYANGLTLEIEHMENVIKRSEGASAAFIKELLRKAALLAAIAQDNDEIVVRDEHIDEALTELLVMGGDLTKSLLSVTS